MKGGGALAAVLAAASIVPAAARAEWVQAETDRFIVYGDAREATVRDYVLKLTTFDKLLRAFHPSARKRTATTKLQVLLVRGGGVRRVHPGLRTSVSGFYTATSDGVFAVAVQGQGDDALLHEYTHHFMLENFPVAYPAWFTEGFAEYYMTAEISSDGRQVKVGGYNQGRVNSVFLEQWLPWNDVLTKRVSQMKPDQVAVFYAQSWLLMHYMRSDETRARQLNAAVDAISKGEDPARAFWKATGETPEQLTRELRAYRRLPMAIAEMKPTAPPAITVTKLPPSADDLLIDHFRLLIADDKSDPAFLADVRRKAARYPDDSFAQMTLARAEFEMGDVAAAEAIVQRRLDARPDDREALLLAGVGKMIAGVRDSAKRRQYFNEARPLMAKVYALDPSDFRPLYAYALCRSADPAFPTENDVDVLLEARELAPSVQEISFRAGLALLRRERREDALKVLGPVLNDPHGGGMAERARALIEGKGDAAGDESASPDAG